MDYYERIKRFQSCHRKSTHGNDKICSSWVYSPESNVHITRSREWFEDDYMAFSSIVYHTHDEPWSSAEKFTNHGLELNPEHYTWAHGVGTVILKTRRSPNRRPNTKGNKNMSELVLKNVIFAPNYICNVIGGNIAQDGYVARVGPGSIKCEGEIRDSTGFQVAHFRNNRNTMQQIEVRIWGPPLGRELKERSAFPTRIRLDLPYFKHDIQAKWPAEERCRFERYRSTRFPSVNIGKKPWSEEELQWLRNEGINFDEMVERARIGYDKEHPADAGSLKTRKIVTILRGKHRAQWLKNPFQDQFDTHTRFREALKCGRGFSFAQNGFVNQLWGDAKGFMDMYGYRYEVDDDCGMAAIQVKDIMRGEGLEVSSDEEWEDEDEDEDESGWEDTDEDICECEHNKCECVDGID